MTILQEKQRKSIETQRANADIAKAEKEVSLKAKEIEVKKNSLAAEIKHKQKLKNIEQNYYLKDVSV